MLNSANLDRAADLTVGDVSAGGALGEDGSSSGRVSASRLRVGFRGEEKRVVRSGEVTCSRGIGKPAPQAVLDRGKGK